MNIEQQRRTSGRLRRQLPANKIKETTTNFTRSQHVNKNSKIPPNQSEKITGENQRQSPSRRLQTDLAEIDTNRSLSSVPTYSSLSRQTPETRECATQITTLTPTDIVEDSQELSDDSLIPIDDQPLYLLEEAELMPISNGFSGAYPLNYRSSNTKRMVPPQTDARDPQNYYEQFRNKQREKHQNERPRPTAVKQVPQTQSTTVKRSPPSDSLAMTTKRRDLNSKVPNNDAVPNSFRRIPPKESVVESPPAPVQKKRVEPARKNGVTNFSPKYVNTPETPQDLGRKPVRVLHKRNNAYYPSPTSSVILQKPASVPQEYSEKPRLVRVANNDYIIERRRQPVPDYAHDDYHRDSFIERPRPKRLVRLVQDESYPDEDDDNVYYVESPRTRRVVTQKPPPAEYVYVDDPPAQIRHRRAPPPPARHSGAYYVDDGQPIDHNENYIYVDEDGNEVEVIDERSQSPEYVQYIHDGDRDKRRSHKSRVIYVDDDENNSHVREKVRSKQPSTTRVVYE